MGKPQSVYGSGDLATMQQLAKLAHSFGVGRLDWDRYEKEKTRHYLQVGVGKGYKGGRWEGEPDYHMLQASGEAVPIAQFILKARELGFKYDTIFAQDGYANGVDDSALQRLLNRAQKEVSVAKPFLVYWDGEGEETASVMPLSSAACLKASTPKRRMFLAIQDFTGGVDNETVEGQTWSSGEFTAEVGRYALGQRGNTTPFLAILCADEQKAQRVCQQLGALPDRDVGVAMLYTRVQRVIGGPALTTPVDEPDLPEGLAPAEFDQLLS